MFYLWGGINMILISFSEAIELSINGDEDALIAILLEYRPLIHHHSFIDGHFDEDCHQYILLEILSNIGKFRQK